METKLIAMILGVALVLATVAVYTQSTRGILKQNTIGIAGLNGGNGVTDGQTAHGLAAACSHSQHNPNCGQTSPGGLRVKPVEGW